MWIFLTHGKHKIKLCVSVELKQAGIYRRYIYAAIKFRTTFEILKSRDTLENMKTQVGHRSTPLGGGGRHEKRAKSQQSGGLAIRVEK